jgi:hypothetical protein
MFCQFVYLICRYYYLLKKKYFSIDIFKNQRCSGSKKMQRAKRIWETVRPTRSVKEKTLEIEKIAKKLRVVSHITLKKKLIGLE